MGGCCNGSGGTHSKADVQHTVLHQLMEIPKLHNFILYYIVYPENFMPLYWSFSEQKIDQMPVKLDNIT